MQILQRVFLVLSLAAVGLVGCKKDEPEGTPPLAPLANDESAPLAKPTQPTAPTQPAATAGKVLETMNSGGYTYAKLEMAGKEVWVAGPETTLTVGQQVAFSGGSVMRDFHSKTLDRTFAEIQFVTTLGPADGAAATPASPHAASPGTASPHGGGAAAKAPVEVGKVEPAEGGMTIADLFAKKDSLKDKPVVVRGKVVKFNAGIMGKNWLHIQDGSGAAGSSDLTVTTQAVAKVGDVVTVKGKVGLDRDFGAGYKYAVIVEDAAVEAK